MSMAKFSFSQVIQVITSAGWLQNMNSFSNAARSQEHSWVEHALSLLCKEELTSRHTIAWVAYHAYMQHPVEDSPAQCVHSFGPSSFLQEVCHSSYDKT